MRISALLNQVKSKIYEAYPSAVGKVLRIDVISRYPVPDIALAFLEKAADVASQLNIAITHQTYSGAHSDAE
jgi:hypothetical protein